MAVQTKDPLFSVIETSDRGDKSVAVTLQNQITDVLDLYFLQSKVTGLTLSVNTVIGQRTITLTAGHGLTTANSAGHILEISHNNNFYQSRVLSVSGDVVTLGQPLNDIYLAIDSSVQTGNPNISKDAATGVAIDGSVTPVIFTVRPLPDQSGDITRIVMATTSLNESDLTTFGGAPSLTVGLTLRYARGDGTFKNIFNYRNNFDIILHGFDNSTYLPKQGNATRGFTAHVTFAGQEKHGVAIRLEGSRNEELQIVVSELMVIGATGNISVNFLAEGSELQR